MVIPYLQELAADLHIPLSEIPFISIGAGTWPNCAVQGEHIWEATARLGQAFPGITWDLVF